MGPDLALQRFAFEAVETELRGSLPPGAGRKPTQQRAAFDGDAAVHRPAPTHIPDDLLQQRVRALLAWHATLGDARIEAFVAHGRITLSGHVDRFDQKQAAESDIAMLAGVAGVANRIKVVAAHGCAGRGQQP